MLVWNAHDRAGSASPRGVAAAPPHSLAAHGPGVQAGLGLTLPLPLVLWRPLNFFSRCVCAERDDRITHAVLGLASLPWEGGPGARGGWEQGPWSLLEGP